MEAGSGAAGCGARLASGRVPRVCASGRGEGERASEREGSCLQLRVLVLHNTTKTATRIY